MSQQPNIAKKLILPLAATLCLGACGTSTTDTNEIIRNAEMSVAAGDMVAARSVAEKLTGDSLSLSSLSATQLCRLSLVYMQLAEQSGYGDLMANAAYCYRKAFEENADSARMFYDNPNVDQTQLVRNLEHIVVAGDAEYNQDDPGDSIDVALLDSIIDFSPEF